MFHPISSLYSGVSAVIWGLAPQEASDSLLGSPHSLTSVAQRERACRGKLPMLTLCPQYTPFRWFGLE